MKWKCTVCGYIHEGTEPPQQCPICGVTSDLFVPVAVTERSTKDTDERILIIGGGAAAYECALTVREANRTCAVVILSEEETPPYYRPSLSKMIAEGLQVENILLEKESFYDAIGIALWNGVTVTKIDPENRTVYLDNGGFVTYDKLCICTGARAFNPIQAGENGIPMQTLRTYADAVTLTMEARKKNHSRALIIGGGILGIEAAESLVKLGVSVTIAERSDRILAAQPDSDVSAAEQVRLEGLGITILTNISATETVPTGVRLADSTVLEADFLLVSAGIRSNVAIAQEAGLAVNGGILVNAQMQTTVPTIYAAGDCAEYNGKVAGHWSDAIEQGEKAGTAMTN